MKKTILFSLLGTLMISLASFRWAAENTPDEPLKRQSKIQLALLLDTSNSMDGLIEQAKAKLWTIVNDMTDTEMNGDSPEIEIALYEYGNDKLSMHKGYIRQLSPFTSSVDDISEKLFSLTTDGGKEYCGNVIYRALDDLEWNENAAYKVMFIAGNESFNQGPVSFHQALSNARNQDVIVNTIFCGAMQKGIQMRWKEGAEKGQGDFFVINQNEEIKYITAPQDEEISALNKKLNETYLPYGKDGNKNYQKLKNQDENASSYGTSNMASRAIYKSKKQYNNAQWDLIDAYDKSSDIVNDKDNLPESYRQLEAHEVKEKINKLKQERKRIKSQIANLGNQRASYIKTARQTQRVNDLDNSMLKTLQSQMKERGIHKKEMGDAAAKIDYHGFDKLTQEVQKYRQTRLVDVKEFVDLSREPNTVILDTRSEWAYNGRHIKGAIHLNFSDFTADKLAELIPDQNTRILIYCNNNFFGDPKRMALKSGPLALNIPTFINLYGYGYKNIYELKNLVSVDDKRMQFEGTAIK